MLPRLSTEAAALPLGCLIPLDAGTYRLEGGGSGDWTHVGRRLESITHS